MGIENRIDSEYIYATLSALDIIFQGRCDTKILFCKQFEILKIGENYENQDK